MARATTTARKDAPEPDAAYFKGKLSPYESSGEHDNTGSRIPRR